MDPLADKLVHFTSGGPEPVGADVVQLQKLRGLGKLHAGIDALMFPHLLPTGCGGSHTCPRDAPVPRGKSNENASMVCSRGSVEDHGAVPLRPGGVGVCTSAQM